MKHFFYSFFFFIITYALFFFNVYHLKEHEITILLQGQSQQLSSAYKAVTSMYSISIESYFKFVVLQPNVVDILHKAQKASLEEKAVLRGELYRSLYPTYHDNLVKYGIRQLHFHTIAGESFLRFHQPEENADPLLDIRPTIKKASQERRFVTGFEGGRVYPGFRYVYPIVDKEVYLGTVELSLSYERIVLELAKLIPAQHYLLILDKQNTTDLVFQNHKDHFDPSPLSDAFTIENPSLSSLSGQALNSPLLQALHAKLKQTFDIDGLLRQKKLFSLPVFLEDESYCVSFYPIFTIENRLAGYVITYTSLHELRNIANKYIYIDLLGALVIALLIFGVALLFRQHRRILIEKMQFETIVSSTVYGVLLLDNEGIICYINPAGARILGYPDGKELINKNAHSSIHVHCDEQTPCPILEHIRHQMSYRGEALFSKKSGEQIFVHLNLSPFIQDDHIVGGVIIFRNITEEKQNKERIEHLAYYDSLTDLPNRKLLLDRLAYHAASSQRTGQYNGILYLDLDNFKELNDTLGHDYGDLLLQKIAQRLCRNLRECDTVSRFGGDEFVILITALSNDPQLAREELLQVAQKLLYDCAQPFNLKKTEYSCSASIGGTLFQGNRQSLQSLLKQADDAMYVVKRSGKNKINII